MQNKIAEGGVIEEKCRLINYTEEPGLKYRKSMDVP